MPSAAELTAMRRAIALARSPGVPLGPNPRVGAVLLDPAGEPIAEGLHRGAGTPHAETHALAAAGSRARGATAVVTLEPCNHTGRTGPCAAALIEAGVSRVVFAQDDLNPVARGGADTLRAAGVDVEGEILADEAEQTNTCWTVAQRRGRPHVTWKCATSLDGRSAAADGTSKWITGTEARADVHRLRAGCDAILVGTGTVLADDPRLTVRLPAGARPAVGRQPLRAVMGLRPVSVDAHVMDDSAPSMLLTTREPGEALAALHGRGIQHVFLEGGPTLAAAFLGAGLVDEVVAYVAPALLGAGRPAVADLGISTLADTMRFELSDVTRLGADVRLVMTCSRSPILAKEASR